MIPATSSAVAAAIVEITAVTHTYPGNRRALTDVSLRILPGERLGLIGPSGAGKSTLLRIINGLVTPSQGRVSALGIDVTALAERDRIKVRRRIGMVFQEFALIERLSVLTNVLVGRLGYTSALRSLTHNFTASDVELARSLIHEVGLDGYEDQQVRRLSGGQKQRVGIARAMAQSAPLILGDEPTANLDVRTADDTLALLVELGTRTGTTMALSLHDVRAARRYCTRVVALRAGELVWDGLPANLDEHRVEDIFYQ